MVYLIGGSSRVGKTLLAQKLMEKYQIPYVSLDHLKMAFIRNKMTDLTLEDDLELRYWMWPFVVEYIKTIVENQQDIIIEGCYIPAEWQASFSDAYLKHIQSVFLVMSEDYLRQNEASVRDKANVIEQRVDNEINLERLITCSQGFKEDAIEEDIPYLEITDKYDINEILKKAELLLELSYK